MSNQSSCFSIDVGKEQNYIDSLFVYSKHL